MPSTHDAYLHVITGGYNEHKRKKVRKLFQSNDEDEEETTHNNDNYDLIVGAMEEIHAVGVKAFKVSHICQILTIFEVSQFFTGDVDKYLEKALATMAIPRSDAMKNGSVYTTPDVPKLETLRRQFCPEEKENERKEEFSNA